MNFEKMVNDIYTLYSQKRIERSMKRLTKVWNKEFPSDRIPFTFYRIPDSSNVNVDKLEAFGYSHEENLYYQLLQLKERAVLEDDFIPSLYPGYRQNMIPSAFGAPEEIEDNQYWSIPIIKSPEDVYNLGEPDFLREGSTSRLLMENIRYFRKKTNGMLPIHTVDSQEAVANGSTLMDVNEYLMALYTNPEEMHFLNSKCTEAVIKFIDMQIEFTENNYIPMNTHPFGWIPKGEGVSLSLDLLALISPSQVEEFVIPYLNRISNHFNGVLVHSCGRWDFNLEAIKKTEKLRGINIGFTETDLETAFKVFGDSIEYALHNSFVSVPPLSVESQEDFIKKVSRIIKDNKIPAQVHIFTPADYTFEQVLDLNKLAIRYFSL